MVKPPTDEELVAAFKAATEGLSQDEAAAQAVGITQAQVSRWRRGAWKRLNAETRRALQAYLDTATNGQAQAYGLMIAANRLEQTVRELRAEAEKQLATPRPSDAVLSERARWGAENVKQAIDDERQQKENARKRKTK